MLIGSLPRELAVDAPPRKTETKREPADASAPLLSQRELDDFRRGESNQLEKVYCAHVNMVARIIRGHLRRSSAWNEADVADLIQEVFAKAFSEPCRKVYDGVRLYGPLLSVIARHVFIDWIRRRRRELVLPANEMESLVEAAHDSEDETSNELGMLVEQFLARVPESVRVIHRTRFVESMSQKQAAEALGISRQRLRTLEAKLLSGMERFMRHRELDV